MLLIIVIYIFSLFILFLKSDAEVFTKRNATNRIGKVYKKVVYRKCKTPSCLEITKEHPAYLGVLGPILRAEVGDTLRIHFTNNASRNFSVHPHGVFYKKNSEGALYNDGTSGKLKEDDGVAPNKRYTYVWEVKKEHGPTQGDSDCLTWAYHSHVNPMKDINTGLAGTYRGITRGGGVGGVITAGSGDP